MAVLRSVVRTLCVSLRTRADLQLEILALRHQLVLTKKAVLVAAVDVAVDHGYASGRWQCFCLSSCPCERGRSRARRSGSKSSRYGSRAQTLAIRRSLSRRHGDRFLERLRIISCCFRSSDSATTARTPPGPASRATVASTCQRRTVRSRTAQS